MDINWKALNNEMELAAIWLHKGAFVEREGKVSRQVRITKGDRICVIDGELASCAQMNPTHKIIGCVGTIDSSVLKLITVSLSDNQPLIVEL